MGACGPVYDRIVLNQTIMADSKEEFTNVTSLRAEALGEHGQRTFRILVDSGSGSAVIWLEKEQLFQLALAINQLLATMSEEQAATGAQAEEVEASPSLHLEFKVGKLVLSHDGNRGEFIIDAHDVESGEDDPATVRVWSDRTKVRAFAEEALAACASGRPVCPLCGSPIDDTGHRCARTNGHGLLDLKDM